MWDTASQTSILKGFSDFIDYSNYFRRGYISRDNKALGTNDALFAIYKDTLSKEEKGLSNTMH